MQHEELLKNGKAHTVRFLVSVLFQNSRIKPEVSGKLISDLDHLSTSVSVVL